MQQDALLTRHGHDADRKGALRPKWSTPTRSQQGMLSELLCFPASSRSGLRPPGHPPAAAWTPEALPIACVLLSRPT